jgi:hypothetical protein
MNLCISLLEKNNMTEVMSKYILEEQVGKDGALPVYTSSVQMFGYIKGSVKRCTALTAGKPFYALYREFQGCLMHYGGVLRQKLTQRKEEDVCYVVNTAEYVDTSYIPLLQHCYFMPNTALLLQSTHLLVGTVRILCRVLRN